MIQPRQHFSKVASEGIRLHSSSPLNNYLQSLPLHHKVASLTVLYFCFHAYCTSELANFLPSSPPMASLHKTFCLLNPIPLHLLMRVFTSIFALISRLLVTSGTVFLLPTSLTISETRIIYVFIRVTFFFGGATFSGGSPSPGSSYGSWPSSLGFENNK